jgi:hypothetical protein
MVRLAHAAEALRGAATVTKETWPDFLAIRYALLVKQFERIARQAPSWRALLRNAAEGRPPPEVIVQARALTRQLSNLLVDDASTPSDTSLIDLDIVQGLRELADTAGQREGVSDIEIGMEDLAVDLLDSIDNIFIPLAEAWLERRGTVSDFAKKSAGKTRDGFGDEFPKQAEKLGRTMAKIAIWSPLVGGAGFLAEKFDWFAAIVRHLPKFWP